MSNLKSRMSMVVALAMFTPTIIPSKVQAISSQEYNIGSERKISNMFNKFRYQMSVEWDQQDPYFKDYAQKELENSLTALRAEGTSLEEIQSFMENNILDEKNRVEYQRLVATVKKQNLNEKEASALAMAFMEKNYRQGSSFAGGSSVSYKKALIVVGVVIVGVVTYFIIKNSNKKDSSSNGGTTGGSTGTTTGGSTGSTTGGSTGSTTGGSNGNGNGGGSNGNGNGGGSNGNGNGGGSNGNNGWGNGDQDAPGNSCQHNNAENQNC